MRILLLLLTPFIALAAAAQTKVYSADQLTANKTYTIYNPHFTTYAIFSPNDHATYVWAAEMTGDDGHTVKNDSYLQTFDPTSPYGAWMVVEYDQHIYLYNVGAQKFLVVGVTGGTQATTLQDQPQPVSISDDGNGNFNFITTEGLRNYMCAAPQMDYPISVWSSDDAGAQWEITESTVPADYEACIALLETRVPRIRNLQIITRCGNIYPQTNGGGFTDNIVLGQPLTFSAQSLDGYSCTDGVVISHGHDLDDLQYLDGEKQWSEYSVPATQALTTIPADSVDGDVRITAIWERVDENADELVFSDEFDGEGEPTADYWVRTPRAHSTWNRWCSTDPRVVYEQGGALHCLAIPTPDDAGDTEPMITGGIKSQGLFAFQYGHAEARIKTNQWRGNFPAFWMMPADNSAGWPNAGEIDIWEAIDTSTQSWHTVHTNWTYNLHQGTNSQTYNNVDYNCWHTYAVDWDEQAITWYVDGNKVWSYTKSTDSYALDNGQWPFDAEFYLILNQSVGNGSWAANADTSHTYETLFDWVRVYQPTSITGIQSQESRVGSQESMANSPWYDLRGRKLSGEPTTRGVYLHNGKKIIR